MAQRNILTIFLASPGDLKQEREEAHRVVGRLNKAAGVPLNWQVDLLGWEDTTPGYSRPQEKINIDVDRCDLFVGLIWQRWGSPTGTHTSGFHEEFERALTRRRSESTPEIWLFFKRIPEDRLRDPGEQLREVLSFRTLQEEHREPRLVTIALQNLMSERLKDVAESIENLLLHSHDSIRARALSFLVKKGSTKYFEELLARYLRNEYYFYDVVCHLDQVIYAPEPLRSHFKRELIGLLV